MQRFVLQENIRNFRERLAETADPAARSRLTAMIAGAERELALLEAAQRGVRGPWEHEAGPELEAARAEAIASFHAEFDGGRVNASLLDPAPGLLFVAVGGVQDVAAGRPRGDLIGKPLFHLFPDNPADPSAEGVHHLYGGLRAAADSRREQAIETFRYDVQSADGAWSERWWRSTCRPISDDEGRLLFVALLSEDVTDQVLAERDA